MRSKSVHCPGIRDLKRQEKKEWENESFTSACNMQGSAGNRRLLKENRKKGLILEIIAEVHARELRGFNPLDRNHAGRGKKRTKPARRRGSSGRRKLQRRGESPSRRLSNNTTRGIDGTIKSRKF